MRGKTSREPLASRNRKSASMRPPQNAGENEPSWLPPATGTEASMRPPQNAGENRKREYSYKDVFMLQ